MILLRLFWEFFKTGLFAVGGGLATLPFLYDMSARTGWFTTEEIADLLAVSESTPGAIGINMSTYAGVHTFGVIGGIIATLGLICPSIIVIIIISNVLKKFQDSKLVQKIFYGLRPASLGLIGAAGLGVAKIALLKTDVFQESGVLAQLFDWKCIILAVCIFFVYRKLKHSPIFYILAAAAVGIIFKL
jgi:chromate transporter